MARRIAIDQLLSCRAINQIRETTTAELALAIAPLPSATDTCTCCKDPLGLTNAWQAPCKHWYCYDCLETLFQATMNDEALYPLVAASSCLGKISKGTFRKTWWPNLKRRRENSTLQQVNACTALSQHARTSSAEERLLPGV